MLILLLVIIGMIVFMIVLCSGAADYLYLMFTIITGDKTMLEDDMRHARVCKEKLPPLKIKPERDYFMSDDFPPIRKAVVPWKKLDDE